MLTDFACAMGNLDAHLDAGYLAKIKSAWLRFDPQRTGWLRFSQVRFFLTFADFPLIFG